MATSAQTQLAGSPLQYNTCVYGEVLGSGRGLIGFALVECLFLTCLECYEHRPFYSLTENKRSAILGFRCLYVLTASGTSLFQCQLAISQSYQTTGCSPAPAYPGIKDFV